MWDFAKFMRNFPEPQKRTKEQWKLIERYSRLWEKHFKKSIRLQDETEFINHCYDNAFFDSWA